jgi:hypothetical protein
VLVGDRERERLICETVNAQGPRAIALVQALCEKDLLTDDQNGCQGHGSSCGHDSQRPFGATCAQIGCSRRLGTSTKRKGLLDRVDPNDPPTPTAGLGFIYPLMSERMLA